MSIDERTGSMAWMYILRCADGSYYVGSTTDLPLRLFQHQQGMASRYTATRRPVFVVYACEFATVQEAYEREGQVKRWSRAKKEALIRGDWSALPSLARGRDRPVGGQGHPLPSTGSGNG